MEADARQSPETPLAALDRYLAACVTACLRDDPAPAWPEGLKVDPQVAAGRVSFHGIALLLIQQRGALDHWPAALADSVRTEARAQSFWERSHRQTIAPLIEALAGAGIEAVLTKGTAMAYSLYPEAALRRRGDSDIVIASGEREATRRVLRQCGFTPCDDVRALQESWQVIAPPNFTHQVDIHWRINASPAISQMLERIQPFTRTIALARLSPSARALAPADNLLLIAINRTAHAALGYRQGTDILFEGDRLIWAADIDLIASGLSADDWERLHARSVASGTAHSLASALDFAHTNCGTAFPHGFIARLLQASEQDEVLAALSPGSARQRLQADLAAAPGWGAKWQVLRHTIFPSRQFLRERYPDSAHSPTVLLTVRRMIGGLAKLLRGRG
jgi:hypothetical protein